MHLPMSIKKNYDKLFTKIKNMKGTFNDKLVAEDSIMEAWQHLSEDYGWTETLLERYQDKLDWELISRNKCIMWNQSMLEKFKERLHWDVLSSHIHSEQITDELLETFKDKWDWQELSANWYLAFSFELIDRFFDYWDWEKLFSHTCRKNVYDDDPIRFYEKYKVYIPQYRIKNTNLWYSIVDKRKEELLSRIIS